MIKNAYNYEFTAVNHVSKIKLSDYKGKLILIINTASLCGFVKQFSEIETVWQKYENKGLIVIVVPSDNFGHQEPKNDQEIAEFCSTNFNTTFIITAKTEVTGENSHPFFKWIRSELGWLAGPKWNFYKFLIGVDGQPVQWFSTLTSPLNKKFINVIDNNLPK